MLFSFITMTATCIGSLLAEFSFDESQQHAIAELIELSKTEIPSEYATECPPKTKSEALEWLVTTTQSKFFARTNERYGLKIPKWIDDNSIRIIELTESAGFISEVPPSDKKIDCVAILGATGTEMQKRIAYVSKLIENNELNTTNIFLLTGERYSTQDCQEKQINNQDCGFIKQDGGINYLRKIAHKHKIQITSVTETQIMEDIYARYNLPKPYVIDTPKGSKKRPDTVDTIIAFMNSPEYYKCNHTAFVSRAPNIKPQHTAISNTYRQAKLKNTFETIGDGAKLTELEDKASVAYQIVMPIAGTIYGEYVNVCKKLSVRYEQCTTKYLQEHLSYNALKKKDKTSEKDLKTPHEDL